MLKSLKRMLRFAVCAAACALFMAAACASDGYALQAGGVFDEAGLFSAEEETALRRQALDFYEETGMSAVILTAGGTQGKSARDFADDYYDGGGFGGGEEKSGFLYLIDMGSREIYISTAGGAITLFSDSVVEALLDSAYEALSEGDYAGSASAVLREGGEYYRAALRKGWSYDRESGLWARPAARKELSALELLGSVLISLFLALSAGGRVRSRYRMRDGGAAASSAGLLAAAGASFAFRQAEDTILRSDTVRRLISVPASASSRRRSGGGPFGSSSTHRSSGGRTHGGGGRKF